MSWAWDPPREVLGLRAQILIKDFNSNVKTLHIVGAECVVCKRVKGFPTLSFVIVMPAVEI